MLEEEGGGGSGTPKFNCFGFCIYIQDHCFQLVHSYLINRPKQGRGFSIFLMILLVAYLNKYQNISWSGWRLIFLEITVYCTYCLAAIVSDLYKRKSYFVIALFVRTHVKTRTTTKYKFLMEGKLGWFQLEIDSVTAGRKSQHFTVALNFKINQHQSRIAKRNNLSLQSHFQILTHLVKQ